MQLLAAMTSGHLLPVVLLVVPTLVAGVVVLVGMLELVFGARRGERVPRATLVAPAKRDLIR